MTDGSSTPPGPLSSQPQNYEDAFMKLSHAITLLSQAQIASSQARGTGMSLQTLQYERDRRQQAFEAVPMLSKDTDWDDWKTRLTTAYVMANMKDHLVTNKPAPTGHPEDNPEVLDAYTAAIMIKQKIKSSLWEELLAEGLKPTSTAYEIFEKAHAVTQRFNRLRLYSMHAEWVRTSRENFADTRAYVKWVVNTHTKLEASTPALGGGDQVLLATLINGFRSFNKDKAETWEIAVLNGQKSKQDVIEEMNAVGDAELAQMSLQAVKHTQSSSSPKPQSKDSQKDNPKKKKSKYPDDWVKCVSCNRHHPQEEHMCETCKTFHKKDVQCPLKCPQCGMKHWRKCEDRYKVMAYGQGKKKDDGKESSQKSSTAPTAVYTAVAFSQGDEDMSNFAYMVSAAGLASRGITNPHRDAYILDSGTSRTISNDLSRFEDYREVDDGFETTTPSGVARLGKGKGTFVAAVAGPNGSKTIIRLPDAIYNPNALINLISDGQLRTAGLRKDDTRNQLVDAVTRAPVADFEWRSNVSWLKMHPDHFTDQDIMMLAMEYKTLHSRLMHPSREATIQAARQQNIKLYNVPSRDEVCDICRMSKATQRVSQDKRNPATRVCERIHVDFIKPTPIGMHAHTCGICVRDEFTGYRWFLSFEKEPQAAKWLKGLLMKLNSILKEAGLPQIREIVTDNAESLLAVIQPYCREKGIKYSTGGAYAHEQNGAAEASLRRLQERARSMCEEMGMSLSFWNYALQTACYVANITPLIHRKDKKSAHRLLGEGLGTHPDTWNPSLRHLRRWGCRAYLLIHPDSHEYVQGAKMAPRAKRCRLIGYEGLNGHIFYVWDPDTRQVRKSRDVWFKESNDPLVKFDDIWPDEIPVEDDEQDDVGHPESTLDELQPRAIVIPIKPKQPREPKSKQPAQQQKAAETEKPAERTPEPPTAEESALQTPPQQIQTQKEPIQLPTPRTEPRLQNVPILNIPDVVDEEEETSPSLAQGRETPTSSSAPSSRYGTPLQGSDNEPAVPDPDERPSGLHDSRSQTEASSQSEP
jgi:hypothetical protein